MSSNNYKTMILKVKLMMNAFIKTLHTAAIAVSIFVSGSAGAAPWNADDYTIFVGDYNNDGLEDIYLQAALVNQSIQIPYNINVNVALPTGNGDVVLQAEQDGSYQLIQNPPLSLIEPVAWQSTSNYQLAVADRDEDGVDDLLINSQADDKASIVLAGTVDTQSSDVIDINPPDPGGNTGGGDAPTATRPPVNQIAGNSFTYSGGYYVGNTPGVFNVSPVGKPNYTVPLRTPPSIGDILPPVSLTYSGLANNDILGVGWYVDGLSQIKRCATTLAQDGYINGVNYNRSDKFCLNGERLFVVRGVYGAPNAEYRTENESYTKIVSFGTHGSGPAYFRVWKADGAIEEYGSTLDSKVVSTESINAWSINRREDREGNYVDYEYLTNINTGEHYINRINFTGNGSSLPRNSIRFAYESRPDAATEFSNGAKSLIAQRVDRVDVYLGSSRIWYYDLSYEVAIGTGRSRLNQLQECLADNRCLKPTTFTWDSRTDETQFTHSHAESDSDSDVNQAEDQQYLMADVNGDGRQDIIWTYRELNTLTRVLFLANANGSGFTRTSTSTESRYLAASVPQAERQYLTGDVNGDGKSDLVWVARHGNDVFRVVYLANAAGNGFDNLGYQVDSHNNYSEYDNGQFQLADVNGDNRADLVWMFLYGNRFGRAVYHAYEDEAGRVGLHKASFQTDSDYTPSNYSNHTFNTGDVNGDGKADIVWTFEFQGSLVRVLYLAGPSGSGFIKTSLQKERDFPIGTFQNQQIQLGDVNADGKSDLIWTYNDNNRLGRVVYQSVELGNAFERVISELDRVSTLTPNNYTDTQFRVTDLNEDGKTDLVYTYIDNNRFGWVNYVVNIDAKGFVRTDEGSNTAALTDRNHHYLTGDINGDGKNDLVWAYNNGNRLNRVSFTLPQSHPDHIQLISDGFDNTIEVKYDYLANVDANIFNKSSGSRYPFRDDNGLSYVVSSVERSNGVGGTNVFDYRYAGAKTHLRGRGFAGFAERSVIDQQSGFTTTERYYQTFPLIGMPQSIVVTQNNGRAVEKVFNHWKSVTVDYPGRDTTFRYIDDQVTLAYDLADGNLVTATLKDDTYNSIYGNLTESVTISGSGFSGAIDNAFDPDGSYSRSNVSSVAQTVITENDYTNNTSNWRIGFLDEVKTTLRASNTPDVVRTTRYTPYNSSSFLTRSEEHFVGSGVNQRSVYSRDRYGNITRTELTGGNIEQQNSTAGPFDDGLYADITANHFSHTTEFKYNKKIGVVRETNDPNDQISNFTYDDFGRQVYSMDTDGTEVRTRFQWCGSGCPSLAVYRTVTTTTHPRNSKAGAPQRITYFDAFDREIQMETRSFTGSTITTTSSYDNRGRLVAVTQPRLSGSTYTQRFQYDDLNRVTREDIPGGGSIVTRYRSDATFASKINTTTTVLVPGEGNRTVTGEFRYDALGRLRQAIDDAGTVTRYQYDAQGETREVIVNGNAATRVTMEYDVAGHRTYLNDPDAGEIRFDYDALGNIYRMIQNPGADEQVTTTHHDAIGRITSRIDDDGVNQQTSNWVYDTATNGIGLIATITGPEYRKTYQYDGLSRVQNTSLRLRQESARTFTFIYDGYSRPLTTRYPSGFEIDYDYNNHGFQQSITDAVDGTLYWQGQDGDSYNNITRVQYGNNVVTNRVFNPATNRIDTISSAVSGSDVQDLTYQFDSAGNLVSRQTTSNFGGGENITERFTYDDLYRLRTATTSGLSNGTRTLTYDYDALGNLRSKTGVSDNNGYFYGENGHGVHAVSRIVNAGQTMSYDYDTKGNMTRSGDRTLEYTVFNKPYSINKPGITTTFQYGPQRQRFYQHNDDSGRLTETFYYDGLFEVVKENSITREKSYVDEFLVHTNVVNTVDNSTQNEIKYLHRDNLGSVDAITDNNGDTVARLAFAPFGDRRQENWQDADATYRATLADTTFANTTHGFTDHEHLDSTGLIHMNGRVYDPVIGRFLSPDQFVQFPESSQSYNRYSYVLNNPLSYTDPSGEFIPLVVYGAVLAWRAYSAYDTVTTAVENAKVIADENASSGEKALAALDTASSVVVPKFLRKAGGKLLGKNKAKKNRESNNKVEASKPNKAKGNDENTAKKNESKASNCACCFVAGTQVLTKDGLKAIDQLQEGDLVASRNEETGEISWKPVITTFVFDDDRLSYELVLVNATGEEQHLEVTDNHPFWVQGVGWLDSIELQPGMQLESYSDEPLWVKRLSALNQSPTTYNIEVEDFNTYFVGEQLVWVHNCDCKTKLTPHQKGDLGVEQSKKDAISRGEKILGEEVSIKLSNGKRTKVDILAEKPDGKLKAIECKNGPCARLTDNQKTAEVELPNIGGEFRGKRALKAGQNAKKTFKPGDQSGPIEFQIDRHDIN